MADDPNPELSVRLAAARARLKPQIRGLADWAATSVSPELRARLLEVQAARQRRETLTGNAEAARDAYIAALTTLEADGPDPMPAVSLQGLLSVELNEEEADLRAAKAVFGDTPAATGRISLSGPLPKQE
jgi:hypothetical protein